jgi:hypothetical protein
MLLGIRLEGWLTIAAIILGPLLAFAVQHWRDERSERDRRKTEIFRRLLLTLKVPMAQNHVDALNSIPLEFYSHSEIMSAWRLYTSHLNAGALLKAEPQRWGEKKFDLLVDLVGKIAKALDYDHIDAATLQDNVYVPKGYQDVEEQWRQIREAWQQVLNGQRPLAMTMVGPIQVEQPMQPLQELLPEPHPEMRPALPSADARPDDGN